MCGVRAAGAGALGDWGGQAEIGVWELILGRRSWGGTGFEGRGNSVQRVVTASGAWLGQVGRESLGGEKLEVMRVGASWFPGVTQSGGSYSESSAPTPFSSEGPEDLDFREDS